MYMGSGSAIRRHFWTREGLPPLSVQSLTAHIHSHFILQGAAYHAFYRQARIQGFRKRVTTLPIRSGEDMVAVKRTGHGLRVVGNEHR